MPRGQRRSASDSVAAQLRAKSDLHKKVPLPRGCKLKTEEDRVIWEQLTNARAADDWREVDLLCVYDCVRFRVQMLRLEERMEEEEVVVLARNGAPTVNPMIKAHDMMQKRYLATLRTIGLGVTNRAAISLNATGKKATAVAERDAIEKSGGKVESLLA